MGFKKKVGRRRFVAGTAALSSAMVAAPFVRGAYAAGKLSVGLWDHWVPGANGATDKLIKEWGEVWHFYAASDEKRAFSVDYEVYAPPSQDRAEILIAVK